MDPVLKQRLIGAGVIWLLAMIFLPLMLGGERQSQSTRMELGLPAEVGAPREVREVRFDATAPEATDPGPAVDETEVAPEVAQPVEPAPESTAEEAAPESAEPSPEPVPEPTAPDQAPPSSGVEAPGGDWFVQVGSFGNQDNALGLKERLEDHEYPALISEYQADGTTLHRVRVGGFDSRETAESVLEALQERMGLNGRVMQAD